MFVRYEVYGCCVGAIESVVIPVADNFDVYYHDDDNAAIALALDFTRCNPKSICPVCYGGPAYSAEYVGPAVRPGRIISFSLGG